MVITVVFRISVAMSMQSEGRAEPARAMLSRSPPSPLYLYCNGKGTKKIFPRCALRAFAGEKRGKIFFEFRYFDIRDSRGEAPGFAHRRCRLRRQEAAPPGGGGAAFLRLPQVVDDHCHFLGGIVLCPLRHADGTQCHHQFLVAPYPELQVVKGTLLRLRLLEVEPSQLAFSIVSDYKWCHGKRLNVF